jgi:peptide deformylase
MALRDIIILPDKRLRTVSKRVEELDEGLLGLLVDMFETMYRAPGIGLAAIQIGVPKRIVTMDLSKNEEIREHTFQQLTAKFKEGKLEQLDARRWSLTEAVRSPAGWAVFINPEIIWSSEEKSVYEEGCLSIPEIHEDVERPARVKFRYFDLDGKPQEADAEGLFATCIQHEVDHLNGVLFIDHISKLKRDRVVKKFTKSAKRAVAEEG